MRKSVRYSFPEPPLPEPQNFCVKPALFRVNTSSNAQGSSYVEIGKSKVHCVVRGPVAASSLGSKVDFSEECEINVSISIPPFASTSDPYSESLFEKVFTSVCL